MRYINSLLTVDICSIDISAMFRQAVYA